MTEFSATEPIDPREFRNVLGHYPTGVAVVTFIDAAGSPTGMVVGSFTSVSLDPPLVGFLPAKSSGTYQRMSEITRFCVNVLAADQDDICRRLASRDPEKFSTIAWQSAPSGAPIIDGAVAWIDCQLTQRYDGGDHDIVLGKVTALSAENPTLPLVFFQGGYGRFSPLSFMVLSETMLIKPLRIVESIRNDLEELASTIGREVIVMTPLGDELEIIASASPDRTERMSSLVGRRMPFVPPYGSLFVAYEDTEARGVWAERLLSAPDTGLRIALDERLARVRSRGWSMAFEGEAHTHVDQVIEAFSAGPHTPAMERDLRGLIESLLEAYDPVSTGSPEAEVRMLAVPVFDSDGHVALQIVIHNLASDPIRLQDLPWVRDQMVKFAARASERRSRPRPPADLPVHRG